MQLELDTTYQYQGTSRLFNPDKSKEIGHKVNSFRTANQIEKVGFTYQLVNNYPLPIRVNKFAASILDYKPETIKQLTDFMIANLIPPITGTFKLTNNWNFSSNTYDRWSDVHNSETLIARAYTNNRNLFWSMHFQGSVNLRATIFNSEAGPVVFDAWGLPLIDVANILATSIFEDFWKADFTNTESDTSQMLLTERANYGYLLGPAGIATGYDIDFELDLTPYGDTCTDCGDLIISPEDMEHVDGDPICQRCIDNNYGWCDNCEEYYNRDYIYHVVTESEDGYFCDACTDNFNRCERCEEYTDNSEYCDNCIERFGVECNCCGELVMDDDYFYINVDGNTDYVACNYCFHYEVIACQRYPECGCHTENDDEDKLCDECLDNAEHCEVCGERYFDDHECEEAND